MGAHIRITPAHRALIEDQIEALLALLDGTDGDCDMEDDDPAGTAIDDAESDDAGLNYRPLYAVDQSRGPTNEQAVRRHYQMQASAGLCDHEIARANATPARGRGTLANGLR